MNGEARERLMSPRAWFYQFSLLPSGYPPDFLLLILRQAVSSASKILTHRREKECPARSPPTSKFFPALRREWARLCLLSRAFWKIARLFLLRSASEPSAQ